MFEVPLWVADMDFEIDKNLLKKMMERVQHNIFGYEVQHPEYI